MKTKKQDDALLVLALGNALERASLALRTGNLPLRPPKSHLFTLGPDAVMFNGFALDGTFARCGQWASAHTTLALGAAARDAHRLWTDLQQRMDAHPRLPEDVTIQVGVTDLFPQRDGFNVIAHLSCATAAVPVPSSFSGSFAALAERFHLAHKARRWKTADLKRWTIFGGGGDRPSRVVVAAPNMSQAFAADLWLHWPNFPRTPRFALHESGEGRMGWDTPAKYRVPHFERTVP